MLKIVSYLELREAGYRQAPSPLSLVQIRGKLYQPLVYRTTPSQALVRCIESGDQVLAHRWKYTAFGNGFPKSGTMMLGQVLSSCHRPFSLTERGPSTRKVGWANERWESSAVIAKLKKIKMGQYTSGHLTADDRYVLNWLSKHEMPVINIYRDLRDICVSYAYHTEQADQKRLHHPNVEIYRALSTHEDRIAAAITGIGEFPSMRVYWEEYAGWLELPWVLNFRFEDMIDDPPSVCTRIARHLAGRRGMEFTDIEFVVLGQWMATAMMKKKSSPTFREGKVGAWKREFTPALVALAREHLGDWLERLGYGWD